MNGCVAYTNYQRFFVARAKNNFAFKRLYSAKVDKTKGVKCKQTIILTGYSAKKDYHEKLRRIKHFDSETEKTFVFLTNNLVLEAELKQNYTSKDGK